MDLAVNILQKLICHKTQPTNQQNPLSRLILCLKARESRSYFVLLINSPKEGTLTVRVDLGVMSMKGYSIFTKIYKTGAR